MNNVCKIPLTTYTEVCRVSLHVAYATQRSFRLAETHKRSCGL